MENEKSYSDKLRIANKYLYSICYLGWDDLPDINSLHDCESVSDIQLACEERLEEEGFPIELICCMKNKYQKFERGEI